MSQEAGYVQTFLMSKINHFKPTKGRPFVLGLPTGSTPLGMYAELIKMFREGKISFANVVTFNITIYNIIRAYQKFSFLDGVDLASWKPTTQLSVQLPHIPIRLHASEPFPAQRLVFGKHSMYQLPSSFQLDRGGLRMPLNTAFQIPPNWSERAHKIQVYFPLLT